MAFSSVIEHVRKGDYTQAKLELLSIIKDGKLKEKDVETVQKYYKKSNSPYVAYILYKAQCSCGMRFEAYDTYITLLKQCSRKRDVSFDDLFLGATNDEVVKLYERLISDLSDDIDIPQSLIVSDIVDSIVPIIWDLNFENKYEMISNLAKLVWFEDLKNSNYIYYLAYSCERTGCDLGEKLYLKLIQVEPANAQALNDIGLMYEKKTDYVKAKFYFSKAYMFCDTNKTYKKNLDRVMQSIK